MAGGISRRQKTLESLFSTEALSRKCSLFIQQKIWLNPGFAHGIDYNGIDYGKGKKVCWKKM